MVEFLFLAHIVHGCVHIKLPTHWFGFGESPYPVTAERSVWPYSPMLLLPRSISSLF